MNRRGFLAALGAAAGGLVLPYEPRRVYSFASDIITVWPEPSGYLIPEGHWTAEHGWPLVVGEPWTLRRTRRTDYTHIHDVTVYLG